MQNRCLPHIQKFANFIVQETESGSRVDKLLVLRYPQCSRTYLQLLIDEGHVRVNGRSVKKRAPLKSEDIVEIHFQEPPQTDLLPQNIPLDILYEDEWLLAVNKPAGMVVHPAAGNWDNTFVNALLFYCKDLEKDGSVRPGIVHRLDKDTSGVLLAAKRRQAHERLVGLFSSRKIYKKYTAVVVGVPAESLIIAEPIGRDPVHRKQMAVRADGKSAYTELKRGMTNGKISMVEVEIKTGRTHQIRVHLQHIGYPVLGDPVYGDKNINKNFNIHRPLLHATAVTFLHPCTGQTIAIHAPLPNDMKKIVDK